MSNKYHIFKTDEKITRTTQEYEDPYICNHCNATFMSDFYKCPECRRGYIVLNKQFARKYE